MRVLALPVRSRHHCPRAVLRLLGGYSAEDGRLTSEEIHSNDVETDAVRERGRPAASELIEHS